MEIIPYPAWRYHTSGRTCVVDTPAVDAALKKGEAGWGDKPLAPPPAEPDPPPFGATDHAPVVEEPAAAAPPDVPAAPAPDPEPDPEASRKPNHQRKHGR